MQRASAQLLSAVEDEVRSLARDVARGLAVAMPARPPGSAVLNDLTRKPRFPPMSGQTSLHLIVGGIACALLPAQPQHSDPLGINPGPLPLYRPGVGFEAGLEAALSHLGTDYRRRAQFVESMLALASRGIPYSTVEAREAQLRPLRDTLAQVREAADVIGTPTRASATELARIKSTLDAAHQGGANASPES